MSTQSLIPELAGDTSTSMAEFGTERMDLIADEVEEDLGRVADRILALLGELDSLILGFPVSQLEHCLQAATRAERAGADIDMVVMSLCHDVGKSISNSNHPAIAAEMLRPWVSDEAYWVVKNHQDFAGRHYYARMGLDPEMRRQHIDHEHYAISEQFADEWDQVAFDPNYDTLPLEHFEPALREVFSRPPRHF